MNAATASVTTVPWPSAPRVNCQIRRRNDVLSDPPRPNGGIRLRGSHRTRSWPPVHPHLFRHARVRQIVRTTKSLPIAQKQAGWSRLQMAYLSVSDDEVRVAMEGVPE